MTADSKRNLHYTHNLSRLFSWSLLYELYKSLSDELSLHKNRSADVVGGYSNRCRFANVSNSNESIENMTLFHTQINRTELHVARKAITVFSQFYSISSLVFSSNLTLFLQFYIFILSKFNLK